MSLLLHTVVQAFLALMIFMLAQYANGYAVFGFMMVVCGYCIGLMMSAIFARLNGAL